MLFPNPPELHFGQEVLHDDLQWLHYYLDDMDTHYPKIAEDIEILKVLNVKQFSEKT
jgi:hypothetical protein